MKIYVHVMCKRSGIFPANRQLTAIRRVGMSLQERIQSLSEKKIRKIRKYGAGKKGIQKLLIQLLLSPDHSLNPEFVFGKSTFPFIQDGMGNTVGFAQGLNRHGIGKIQLENIENKGKGVLHVWNKKVRD